MDISRENYELFFIDYMDGVLTSAQIEELYAFLEQNPDLKKEFEQLEPLALSPDKNVVFPLKSQLKKQSLHTTSGITSSNYQNYLIAKIEGDLSVEELGKLDEFIAQNPGVKQELELYEKTILVPEEHIVFKNKRSLKKFYINPVVRKAVLYTSSLAASILLVFAIFFGLTNNPFKKSPQRYSLRIEKNHQAPVNFSPDEEGFVYDTFLKKFSHTVLAHEPKLKNEIVKQSYRIKPAYIKWTGIKQIALEKEQPGLMTADFEEQYYYTLAYYSINALNGVTYRQQDASESPRASRQRLFSKIKQSLNPELTQKERRDARPDLWDIADIGIAHLNQFTGSTISLNHYETDYENAVQLAFSNKIEYFRKRTR